MLEPFQPVARHPPTKEASAHSALRNRYSPRTNTQEGLTRSRIVCRCASGAWLLQFLPAERPRTQGRAAKQGSTWALALDPVSQIRGSEASPVQAGWPSTRGLHTQLHKA